ncbi:unnamed protein product [Hymenolepis diminuta]|uniref:Secreted protein n=1 Tax=Hymenolepis diminuta TaxID=6216 RepID=A0A0R3SWW7_HYMDI|nr:unnamed protein product [Hymenolepis diminuta]
MRKAVVVLPTVVCLEYDCPASYMNFDGGRCNGNDKDESECKRTQILRRFCKKWRSGIFQYLIRHPSTIAFLCIEFNKALAVTRRLTSHAYVLA